jgi:hypothetical protein
MITVLWSWPILLRESRTVPVLRLAVAFWTVADQGSGHYKHVWPLGERCCQRLPAYSHQ